MPIEAASRAAWAARTAAVARPPVKSGCVAVAPKLKLYCEAKIRVMGLLLSDESLPPELPVPLPIAAVS